MALNKIIETWMGLILLLVFGMYIFLILKKEITERGRRIEENGGAPTGGT